LIANEVTFENEFSHETRFDLDLGRLLREKIRDLHRKSSL